MSERPEDNEGCSARDSLAKYMKVKPDGLSDLGLVDIEGVTSRVFWLF